MACRISTCPLLTISVNFSIKQFTQPNLVSRLPEFYKKSTDAGYLRLELTESMLMENAECVTAVQLKALGFGCTWTTSVGYSSLSYLHRFPINALKIDRSL